jgi:hypothetical protein
MIAAIRNYAGIGAPGPLDLLALPEREKDEPDQKQSDCDSEPLVQRHGTTLYRLETAKLAPPRFNEAGVS